MSCCLALSLAVSVSFLLVVVVFAVLVFSQSLPQNTQISGREREREARVCVRCGCLIKHNGAYNYFRCQFVARRARSATRRRHKLICITNSPAWAP